MRKLTEQDFIDIIGFTFGDEEHIGYTVLKARPREGSKCYGIALVKSEGEFSTWLFYVDEEMGRCTKWGHWCDSEEEEALKDYEVRS